MISPRNLFLNEGNLDATRLSFYLFILFVIGTKSFWKNLKNMFYCQILGKYITVPSERSLRNMSDFQLLVVLYPSQMTRKQHVEPGIQKE